MITTRHVLATLLLAGVAIAACASPRAPAATTPTPTPVPEAPAAPPAPPVVLRAPIPEVNPALPPVPQVNGPLEIKVVYPRAGQLIMSRDSNFIFGSVGNGEAGLTINGVLTPVWPNGAFMGWLANPPASAPQYEIVATTNGLDTVRLTHPVKIAEPPPEPPPPPDTIVPLSPARYASLIGPAAYPSDTDRVVTGEPWPPASKRWLLLPQTIVKVTGTLGSFSFVQLDSTQTIRIGTSDLKMLDSVVSPVVRRTRSFRLRNAAEWTDLIIPITDRPAFQVEEGPSSLTLTLYGTSGPRRQRSPARSRTTSYARRVTAARSGPQMSYTVELHGPVYGFLPLWEEGRFILRVRRPPVVDSLAPLRGLTIAVDPGHPPAGATGPTGLYEAVPVLDVGLKVRELLQAKGVNVVMTRETPDTVALTLRPAVARRVNAHALVSIHLNAVPDGMNPLRAHGTETYYFYPHSQPLAETTQRAAVARMSLSDKGVKWQSLALARGPWMPAILVEGAFMIMPDQEAAIRTREYQERYAQSIVEGLENFFRSFATSR